MVITFIKSLKENKGMTQKDKELIADFCRDNLHTHTDWTGTRVETINHCESIEKFIDKLLDYIENEEE